MRAPRPTPLITHAEAAGVILDALDRRQLQEQERNNSDENEARIREFLARAERAKRRTRQAAEAMYQSVRRQLLTLPPEERGRVAACLNDEFGSRPRRGRPPQHNRHSLNRWIAQELPFFIQVLQARYPTVQITKDWVIEVACVAFPELDENNFRNFLRGPHRPRP